MNKTVKLILLVVAIMLGSGVVYSEAATNPGNPFKAIWDAIVEIKEQIKNIQLIPGPQGPVGPVGPQGPVASQGAGNIAFMYGDRLLKTDGTVWTFSYNNTDGTLQSYFHIAGHAGNVPIPVSDIVHWEPQKLLDKEGNIWYLSSLGGWHKFVPLP